MDVRANGKMLPDYVGRKVRVLCKVNKLHAGQALITTTDGVEVNIRTIPDDLIEDTCGEVVGKVEGPNAISVNAWYPLPTDDENALFEVGERTLQLMQRDDLRHIFT